MIPTPFGADWEDLTLDVIRSFFAAATDETLTWEAKADGVRPDHIRKAASAFGNSTLGGYLVLGVRRDSTTKAWTLGGWRPPDEPRVWISSCLANGGVAPVPPFDVISWEVEDERHVAIVMIRPAAAPPVLTNDGHVFERLPGQSAPVRDSAMLRRLTERGEAALDRAARTAEAGRHDLYVGPPRERPSKLVVSMASPSLPSDASALVFRDSTRRAMDTVLRGPLAADPVLGHRIGGDVSQHAITLWNRGMPEAEGYAIRVGRHGAVAVSRHNPDITSGIEVVATSPEALARLWRAAASILVQLTAQGPVYAAIRLHDDRRGAADIGRWTVAEGPWDEVLASIAREARRAIGQPEWEPESA